MNMLVNYVMKAMAAATTVQQPQQAMVRTALVQVYDRKLGTFFTKVRPVLNSRRLKSRGKGGKTAHSFTGIRAAKRAAVKRRNRKG